MDWTVKTLFWLLLTCAAFIGLAIYRVSQEPKQSEMPPANLKVAAELKREQDEFQNLLDAIGVVDLKPAAMTVERMNQLGIHRTACNHAR